MSLVKPDKMDDLRYNIDIYKQFLSDPEVRKSIEMTNYFVMKVSESVELFMEVQNG